jgi:hypothetical protein
MIQYFDSKKCLSISTTGIFKFKDDQIILFLIFLLSYNKTIHICLKQNLN